jgi:hypothetical protein
MRNFAPPADQSDWFKIGSVVLNNGDDVGVVMPWEYPATWDNLTTEITPLILDELEKGMPNSSAIPAPTPQRARRLGRLRCPAKTLSQCRQIITRGSKTGRFTTTSISDPVYQRRQIGFVHGPHQAVTLTDVRNKPRTKSTRGQRKEDRRPPARSAKLTIIEIIKEFF